MAVHVSRQVETGMRSTCLGGWGQAWRSRRAPRCVGQGLGETRAQVFDRGPPGVVELRGCTTHPEGLMGKAAVHGGRLSDRRVAFEGRQVTHVAAGLGGPVARAPACTLRPRPRLVAPTVTRPVADVLCQPYGVTVVGVFAQRVVARGSSSRTGRGSFGSPPDRQRTTHLSASTRQAAPTARARPARRPMRPGVQSGQATRPGQAVPPGDSPSNPVTRPSAGAPTIARPTADSSRTAPSAPARHPP
jgi:hypothetical protein